MLTARATCPDADQALDPLRDVGTGKLIDALHRRLRLALHTRQDASVKQQMVDHHQKVNPCDIFVRSGATIIVNDVHFLLTWFRCKPKREQCSLRRN